jgi:hypothetical protein
MEPGKSTNFDILGKAETREKTGARMVSPAGGNGSGAVGSTDGLAHTRRATFVKTYDSGEVIEVEDPCQMLADPNQPITKALGNTLKRSVDKIIINAASGAALDGGGSSVTLPTSQVIGDGSTIFTLQTVLEMKEILSLGDVDPDEAKVLVVSPKQVTTLLNDPKLTSSDYQKLQALTNGFLPNFLGFHLIESNMLNVPTTGDLQCLAFTKSAIGLHIAKDIWAECAARPDMSFAWQFYAAMTMGAVRIQDEQVVVAHVLNANTQP